MTNSDYVYSRSFFRDELIPRLNSEEELTPEGLFKMYCDFIDKNPDQESHFELMTVWTLCLRLEMKKGTVIEGGETISADLETVKKAKKLIQEVITYPRTYRRPE